MRRAALLVLLAAPFLPGCRCTTVDSGHRGIVFKGERPFSVVDRG